MMYIIVPMSFQGKKFPPVKGDVEMPVSAGARRGGTREQRWCGEGTQSPCPLVVQKLP